MNRAPVVAVLCCVALVAACDGDPEDSGEETLTRAEFTARVDDICSSPQEAIEGLEPPRNLDETARFLREVLPVIRGQLDRIRALGDPPESGSDAYFEWFEARDAIVEATAQMIAAAEEGDRQLFQQLAAVQEELDERADAAAKEYGFESCGSFGDVSSDG